MTLSSLQDWNACGSLISISERAAAYEAWLQTAPERFGERLRDRLLTGIFVTAADYMQALRRRRELCAEIAVAMQDVDLVLTAAAFGEAPEMDAIPRWDNFQKSNFTMPFNVAGLPAMSVCAGFGPKGLPLAVQLAGRPFEDGTVLRAAHSYEMATAWRDVRPLVRVAELA